VRWCGGELADRLVERVASAFRVEHSAVALVEDDRERPTLEPLPAKPRIVRPRPRSRVVDKAMPQEQPREPMPRPHQIATGVLTGRDETTRRLLSQRRDPHGSDLTEREQPRHPLGVAPVGLDPIRCSPDPRRRSDNAVDPRLSTPTREPVT